MQREFVFVWHTSQGAVCIFFLDNGIVRPFIVGCWTLSWGSFCAFFLEEYTLDHFFFLITSWVDMPSGLSIPVMDGIGFSAILG